MIHEIVVPKAGESVTEAFIGKWRKTSGEVIKKREILVDLESQKATMELESDYAGKLTILIGEEGARVAVGQVIATIDDSVQIADSSNTSASSAQASAAASPAAPKPAPQPMASASAATIDIPLTPSMRKALIEKNIDPNSLITQPKTAAPVQQSAPASQSAASQTLVYEGDVSRGVRREKATRIRQQIAKNLLQAQHSAAILTTFNEIDMSQVLAYREKHKEDFKKEHGLSLGMLGFFTLACVRAMKKFPLINAVYTGEEVVFHDYIDLSVAVSTDRGLVVPVIRDLQQLDLLGFEKKLANISQRAREGKISIPEMTGGTFTISNGGTFGSLLSTPLLNRPQSAILGLHKIEKRPVVINDDQIAIRPMMYVALSYDHRLIDGKEAVQFLVTMKEGIENLDLILAK